ncbi:YraN family protein, partial [Pseudomonas sp. 100_A]|uniref:YraN family protein n=1 Tax=Pseudomonas sp. 100_A TaxID=2813571 RepID=UPI001A9DFCA4
FLSRMSEILSLASNMSSPDRQNVGEIGENLAARFLLKNGYRLVLANFKVPVGRNRRGATVTGEIDLIALDENVLCFVEVKTRTSDEYASPLAAVDLRKQRQIIRAAKVYRKTFQINRTSFRYDAVSVVLRENRRPEIELFKNFWTEEKFRKKTWFERIW